MRKETKNIVVFVFQQWLRKRATFLPFMSIVLHLFRDFWNCNISNSISSCCFLGTYSKEKDVYTSCQNLPTVYRHLRVTLWSSIALWITATDTVWKVKEGNTQNTISERERSLSYAKPLVTIIHITYIWHTSGFSKLKRK